MNGELLTTLQNCGAQLPESARPSPAELPNLIAGLIYWVSTGETEPPPSEEPAAPQPAAATEVESLRNENDRLRQELAARETPPPAVTPAGAEGTTPPTGDTPPPPPASPESSAQ